MSETAVILLGHGSRRQKANKGLAELAEMIEGIKKEDNSIRFAYLQFAEPTLPEVIEDVIRGGAKKVVLAPVFLYPGVHITEDIPEILEVEKKKYPGISILQADNLGIDHRIALSIMEKVNDCLVEQELVGELEV